MAVQRASGARLVGALVAFVGLLLHMHSDDVLLHMNLKFCHSQLEVSSAVLVGSFESIS